MNDTFRWAWNQSSWTLFRYDPRLTSTRFYNLSSWILIEVFPRSLKTSPSITPNCDAFVFVRNKWRGKSRAEGPQIIPSWAAFSCLLHDPLQFFGNIVRSLFKSSKGKIRLWFRNVFNFYCTSFPYMLSNIKPFLAFLQHRSIHKHWNQGWSTYH